MRRAPLTRAMTPRCPAARRLWRQVPALLRGGRVKSLKTKVAAARDDTEGQAVLLRCHLPSSLSSCYCPQPSAMARCRLFARDGTSASLSPRKPRRSPSPRDPRSLLRFYKSFRYHLPELLLRHEARSRLLPGVCALPAHSQPGYPRVRSRP